MSAALVVFAYLCGSIPFGVIVARAFTGKDVRALGSGNIGATNVARVAGKKLGALVLLLDAGKGALPVLFTQHLLPADSLLHSIAGFAAFTGHVYPVWLRLKGGKGVATALGVITVLMPWAALIGFVVWAAIVLAFRVSSIGSLAGGLCAVAAGFFQSKPVEYPVLGVVVLLAMLFTHRSNLARMRQGRENRV